METNEINSLMTPFAKAMVETFIKPKLDYIEKKFRSLYRNLNHDYWSNQFEEYLIRSYSKFSFINTFVYLNHRRQLRDLYVPLTLILNFDIKFVVKKYSDFPFASLRRTLITDTAGMGKTTLLKYIFLSIVEENSGIPVIIELRRLTATHTLLDNIIEQLTPLNENPDKDFILRLIKRGDFIFMLDGYDEIPLEHKQAIVNDIENFIDKAGENIFIVTSRPEGSLKAFSTFKNCNIKPLEKHEAFELLKKYDSSGNTSKLLIEKLGEPYLSDAIAEFLTNPLLVSLLFTGFDYKNVVPFKKHVFYRQVFDSLFESHDLSKNAFVRRKFCVNMDIEDFHRILRFIGYKCFLQNKVEFNKDEIVALIIEARKFNVNLDFSEADFLKDITVSSPILVVDGVYFRWAHKSIQEYFAANFIFLDSKGLQEKILNKIYFSKDINRYRNLLDIYSDLDYKSFRKVIIYNYLKEYITYGTQLFRDTDIPEYEKELRKTVYFHYRLYMARVKFNDEENGEFNRFFKIIERLTKNEPGLSITHVKPFDKYEHLKVAKAEKKHGVIFQTFYYKGREDFLKYRDFNNRTENVGGNAKEESKQTSRLHQLFRAFFPSPKVKTTDIPDLPFDEPVELADDNRAFYNSDASFGYVNEILGDFVSPWYIVTEKAEMVLKELEKGENEDNLLAELT